MPLQGSRHNTSAEPPQPLTGGDLTARRRQWSSSLRVRDPHDVSCWAHMHWYVLDVFVFFAGVPSDVFLHSGDAVSCPPMQVTTCRATDARFAQDPSTPNNVLPFVGLMSLGASDCPASRASAALLLALRRPVSAASFLAHSRHHVPWQRWSKRSLRPKALALPKPLPSTLLVGKGNILQAELRRRILDALPLAVHVGQERVLRLR